MVNLVITSFTRKPTNILASCAGDRDAHDAVKDADHTVRAVHEHEGVDDDRDDRGDGGDDDADYKHDDVVNFLRQIAHMCASCAAM